MSTSVDIEKIHDQKSINLMSFKKIFYTRETMKGIGISPFAEVNLLFHDWLRSLD